MNNIRKNDEEEIVITKAKFNIPIFIIVTFSIPLAFFFLLMLGGLFLMNVVDTEFYETGSSLMRIGLIFSIVFALMFLLCALGIKKSSCIITNKRIKGVINFVIAKKNFSYRLDEVDNVETFSILGFHGLVLNFSQGNGTQKFVGYGRGLKTLSGNGTFRISFISNVNVVYEKLSDLITKIKNEKDLMVDIEMEKIAAENRKADALEKMSINTTNNSKEIEPNYILELKALNELLTSGVITKEEFEEKKQKILKN